MNFTESKNVFFSANDSLGITSAIERASMKTSSFFITPLSIAYNKIYVTIP